MTPQSPATLPAALDALLSALAQLTARTTVTVQHPNTEHPSWKVEWPPEVYEVVG